MSRNILYRAHRAERLAHSSGSDGGWIKDYAAWLKTIFA